MGFRSFRTGYGGVILACVGSRREHLRCSPCLFVGDVVPCDLLGGWLPREGDGSGSEECKQEVGGSLDHWLSCGRKEIHSFSMLSIKSLFIFISTRAKVSINLGAFLDFLFCCRFDIIYYEPSNVPVLRMRVNGSLLVFPLIVYRLTEYVVAGCKSVGG